MTAAVLVLTCGSLIGCGSGERAESARDGGAMEDSISTDGELLPSAGQAGVGPGPAGPDSSWVTMVSYVGHGLLLGSGEHEILRLGCVRESVEMTVDVPGFSSIGSEERLSLGIDGEPYVFVAQVTPPPPAGVHATRSIDEDVLTALEDASTISAHYGSQSSGPHTMPDSATLRGFLAGCRRAPDR